jgi:hypothetical protein
MMHGQQNIKNGWATIVVVGRLRVNCLCEHFYLHCSCYSFHSLEVKHCRHKKLYVGLKNVPEVSDMTSKAACLPSLNDKKEYNLDIIANFRCADCRACNLPHPTFSRSQWMYSTHKHLTEIIFQVYAVLCQLSLQVTVYFCKELMWTCCMFRNKSQNVAVFQRQVRQQISR